MWQEGKRQFCGVVGPLQIRSEAGRGRGVRGGEARQVVSSEKLGVEAGGLLAETGATREIQSQRADEGCYAGI